MSNPHNPPILTATSLLQRTKRSTPTPLDLGYQDIRRLIGLTLAKKASRFKNSSTPPKPHIPTPQSTPKTSSDAIGLNDPNNKSLLTQKYYREWLSNINLKTTKTSSKKRTNEDLSLEKKSQKLKTLKRMEKKKHQVLLSLANLRGKNGNHRKPGTITFLTGQEGQSGSLVDGQWDGSLVKTRKNVMNGCADLEIRKRLRVLGC